jgi:glycerate 2-kinase
MNASESAAGLLQRCFAAAVTAVQPAGALRTPLRAARHDGSSSWVIAIGKAAGGMAAGITDWLAGDGRTLAGGVVVEPDAAGLGLPWTTAVWPAGQSHGTVHFTTGDHPIPRDASARAAVAIGKLVQRIPAGAEVHVALSGGGSALVAGPLPGLTMADVTATFDLLLTSGLDIHEMNAVRKRITRWSAGRLGLALAGRRIHVWVISDVPGDDLTSIASGPCTGDPWTTAEVRHLLAVSRLAERLPASVRTAIGRETPKPGDPGLSGIAPVIVANNRTARLAAAETARDAGVVVRVMDDPLTGEASAMGRRIADTMRQNSGHGPELLVWGGETTVTVTGRRGSGGRSQELCLAAAESLHEAQTGGMLLAGGTDGRDGPTDAAGAVVDGDTWRRIIAAGRDPAADLAGHDAYQSLDAAGALLRTGATGTNVMDLALALTEAR